MNRELLLAGLRRNLRWFVESGIMVPSDGAWGVAERIFATRDDDLRRQVRREFIAYTPRGDYDVIESRRPDCCFETAAMFLMAERAFPGHGYREIAGNILDFLYFRSGLLNRDNPRFPIGAWHWSHVSRDVFWVDDNGWCAAIQLEIFAAFPELRRRYDPEGIVHRLVEALGAMLARSIHDEPPSAPERWEDPTGTWRGYLELPHWGVPVWIALVADDCRCNSHRWDELGRRYFNYICRQISSLSVSEKIYALIGCCFAAGRRGDAAALELAEQLGREIAGRMDRDSGIIPSEHYEAPRGSGLADLIYTMNWALVAFQLLARLRPTAETIDVYRRLAEFILSAQISAPERHLNGAWRGMCDRHGNATGGDCIEGGSGSIYSGWTNAPIALALFNEYLQPVRSCQSGVLRHENNFRLPTPDIQLGTINTVRG